MRTGNQRQAYREAYDAENSGDATVDVKACNLLKMGKVRIRLEQLQERTAKKTETTVESIDAMLEEAFQKAKADPKGHAGMVAAAMGKAKLHGLIINKSEDVTNRESSKSVDARIHQLLNGTKEAGAVGSPGTPESSAEPREAVPTVPGHGTA